MDGRWPINLIICTINEMDEEMKKCRQKTRTSPRQNVQLQESTTLVTTFGLISRQDEKFQCCQHSASSHLGIFHSNIGLQKRSLKFFFQKKKIF